MGTALFVDGAPAPSSADMPQRLTLSFADGTATHRCRRCGDLLAETVAGFESSSAGSVICPHFVPDGEDPADGPHDAEPIPLSWCNNAAVMPSEEEDAVTVSISVGDVRGGFTFTVRRIPDDGGELAGRLVMHLPYPGEAFPHAPLSELDRGTFLIGHQ